MRALLMIGGMISLLAGYSPAKASIMLNNHTVDFGNVVVGSQVSTISVTLNYNLGPGQNAAYRFIPSPGPIDVFVVDATNCPGVFNSSGSCRIGVSLNNTSPGSFQSDSFTIGYFTVAQPSFFGQVYEAQLNLRANIVAATAVPEPASLALLGAGVITTGLTRRRRTASAN